MWGEKIFMKVSVKTWSLEEGGGSKEETYGTTPLFLYVSNCSTTPLLRRRAAGSVCMLDRSFSSPSNESDSLDKSDGHMEL